MKHAPLQLLDYWVDFIQVRANANFDPGKPSDLDIHSIDLQSDTQQLEIPDPDTNGTMWIVNLRIEQPLGEDKNIPYTYTLEITGRVAAHPKLKDEKLQRTIQVNGPSMLFGSAREILRAATSRGPFAPIIIPSTNFFSCLPEKEEDTPNKLPASDQSQNSEDKKD